MDQSAGRPIDEWMDAKWKWTAALGGKQTFAFDQRSLGFTAGDETITRST